jgi:hypothetical protein
MSWETYYQRRDALNLVLDYARCNPDAGLPFDELPEVKAVFRDREELALALQYKWTQILTGRMMAALSGTNDAPGFDLAQAVASAWRTAATTNPVLRRLLDGYRDEAGEEFNAAIHAEHRMIAFATGLADFDEPVDVTTRIGTAFLALVDDKPQEQQPVRKRSIEQLFRRVVPSS